MLGQLELTNAGNADAFVAQLSTASGAVLWAASGGGLGLDQGNAVGVDGAGGLCSAPDECSCPQERSLLPATYSAVLPGSLTGWARLLNSIPETAL